MGKKYTTNFLEDTNGSTGASNQVLISTPTGIDWVDGSGSSIIGGPYVTIGTTQTITGTKTFTDTITINKTTGVAIIDIISADNYSVLTLKGGQTGDATNGFGIYSGYPSAGDFTIRENGVANYLTIAKTTGNATFAGNITVSGTSSSFNTGNSGTFVTNDASNYPRFTMTNASAQLGLFRAGGNAGGMYIGGAGDGFRLYTSSFSQKLFIDTNGNATFAGTIDSGTITSTGIVKAATTFQATSGDMTFYVNNVGEAMRIQQNTGRVGIGTTLPTTALTIRKSISPTAYGGEASMIEFKSYYTGYDTETVKSAIYSGVSDQTGLQTARGFMSFWTSSYSATGVENLTEKMRIESDGSVGIGTDSPEELLHIKNGDVGVTPYDLGTGLNIEGTTSNVGVNIVSTNTGQGRIYFASPSSNTAGAIEYNHSASLSSGFMKFRTGNSERMRIDGSGRVGIGTTGPTEKLDVSGTAIVRSTLFTAGNVHGFTSSYGASFFINNGGGTSYFNATGGNVGVGLTNPSAKLHIQGTNSGVLIDTSTAYTPLIKASGTLSDLKLSSVGNGGNLVLEADCTIASIIQFNNGGTERMRIDSSGRVGIGTTSPDYKLEVESTSDADLVSIKSTAIANNTQMRLGISGNDSVISGTGGSSGNLVFKTYGSERMRIASNGNVGIGTTSPKGKVDIQYDMDFNTGSITGLTAGRFQYGNINFSGVLAQASGSTGTSMQGITWQVNNYGGSADYGNQAQLVVGNNGTIGTFMGFFTSNNYSIAPVERLRVDSVGNVGIGTTSPQRKLTIYESSGNAVLQLANNTSGVGASDGFLVYTDGVNVGLENKENGYLSLATNASERIRIDSAGNVGIGTTGPLAKLQVSGNSLFESDIFTLQNKGIFFNGLSDFSSGIAGIDSGTSVRIFAGGSEKVRVKSTGNVGIGTTSPSAALHVYDFSNGEVKFQRATGYSGLLHFGFPSGLPTIRTSGNFAIKASNAWGADFYISSSGNVGIGTTTPDTLLHLKSSSPKIKLQDTGNWGSNATGGVEFYDQNSLMAFSEINSAGDYLHYLVEAGNMRFGTSNTERMRITSAGNVGIGLTNPGNKLEVVGNIRANDGYIRSEDGATGDFVQMFNDGANTGQSFITTSSLDLVLRPQNGVLQLKGENYGSGNNASLQIYNALDASVKVKLNSNGDSYLNGGNVGIGTTSPTIKFQAVQTTADWAGGFKNYAANAYGLRVDLSGSSGVNAAFQVYTATGNGIIVKNNGNVGIGTTGPTDKLTVNGNLSIFGNKIYNGSASNSAGVSFPSSTTRIDGYNGITFHSSQTTVGSQTERMRIDSSGKVSVGSPIAGQLGVRGTTNDSTAYSFEAANSSGNTLFIVRNDGEVWMPSGNVGIGTTSPGRPLTINSDTSHRAIRILENDSANESWDIGVDVDGDLNFFNSADTSPSVTFLDNGNVGMGTTDPDEKLVLYKYINYASDSALYSAYAVNSTAVDNNKVFKWRTGITGNQTGHNLTFSTLARTESSYTERMRIDSSGNTTFAGAVGIGGTTPSNGYMIDITPTAGNIIRSTRGTSVFGAYQSNNSDVYLGTISNNTFKIITNDGTAITIGADKNATFAGSIYANTIYSNTNSSYYIDVATTSLGLNMAGSATFAGKINITQNSGNFILENTGSGHASLTTGSSKDLNISSASGTVYINNNTTFAGIIYAVDGNKGAPGISFANDTDTGIFRDSSDKLAFATGANTRMIIESNGEVGINQPNPSATLHLKAIASNGVPFKLEAHPSTSVSQMLIYATKAYNSTDAWYNLVCEAGDGSGGQTNTLIIERDGDVRNKNNSYGQISDIRLKENITDATPKLEDIKKLKVKNFNLIGDDLKQIGLIAQEVEEVFPGLVKEDKQPDVNGEEGGVYKSVKYSVLVPMLIKAMQEQQEQIDELKKQINN